MFLGVCTGLSLAILQLLAGVSFLSSYTTFSTLMWDTFSLAQTGSVLMALLNLGASVTLVWLPYGWDFW
jgi:fluoride ion exporter CrcB/FEX